MIEEFSFEEYCKLAVRTAGTFESPRMALAYWTLGIVGEGNELEEAYCKKNDIIKECGDVTWYVAMLANQLEIWDVSLPSQGEVVHIAAAEIAEHVKKHLGHGRPIDKEFVSRQIGFILQWIREIVWNEQKQTLSYVFSENIAKLQKRFPDGFSHEASLARADVKSFGSH